VPKVSAEHKEQVRQRLIDAARTVVLRDGHEGTTTRAILAEAGLSAGALYTYFSSKEELFEALVEDALGDWLRRVAAQGQIDSPTQLVRQFALGLLTFPDLPAVAWFRGRMSTAPDVSEATHRFNRYVVDTFTPFLRDAATVEEPDVEAIVELFDVVVEGLNRREVLGTFATSFDRVGAIARALLVEAVIQQENA